MSATDETPEHTRRRILPHDAARLLVAEFSSRGMDAGLQPFLQGRAWVPLWGGLLVNGVGLLPPGSSVRGSAIPIWGYDPSTAATKLVTRHDELRVQHPTHGPGDTQSPGEAEPTPQWRTSYCTTVPYKAEKGPSRSKGKGLRSAEPTKGNRTPDLLFARQRRRGG